MNKCPICLMKLRAGGLLKHLKAWHPHVPVTQ